MHLLTGTVNSTNITTTNSSLESGIDLTEIFTIPEIDTESVKRVLHVIDIITVIYFSFEYVVRFCCSPHKAKFFIKPMNLVDFLAILPYIISFFLQGLQDLHILSKAGKVCNALVFDFTIWWVGNLLFFTVKRQHNWFS